MSVTYVIAFCNAQFLKMPSQCTLNFKIIFHLTKMSALDMNVLPSKISSFSSKKMPTLKYVPFAKNGHMYYEMSSLLPFVKNAKSPHNIRML